MPRTKRQPGRPKNPLQRKDLINIAGRQFASAGYAGASMNAIAEAAGIRKPSLFHHFEGKDAMYREVLLNSLAELDTLVEETEASECSHTDRLLLLSRRLHEFFRDHPYSPVLIIREVIDDQLFREEEGDKAVSDPILRLAAFLSAGMQAGEFHKEDPRQMAMSFISLHFLYFAAGSLVSRFLRTDIHDPGLLKKRQETVLEQVRRLCCR